MTRRSFHKFASTAAVLTKPIQVFADSLEQPWKLGIITDQVDLNLNHALSSFFPKYQLRWAEIRYLRLDGQKRYVYADATPSHLKDVRQQLDDAGVTVSVLDTAIFKITLPGTVPVGENPAYVESDLSGFGRQMDDLKRAADAAHLLGCERIRIFTFRRVARPEAIFWRVVEELQRAIHVAKEQDITLLVENEYDCNTGTTEEIMKLFRAIPDRRLMHNWDPCNSYEMDEEPSPGSWEQLDHSRISHIHLKDAVGQTWKPIGAGKIDFAGIFQGLKRARYSGTLSVETRFQNAQRDQYASSVESMDGLVRVLKSL
jgi:sugar phosphate isomerase/epimerase